MIRWILFANFQTAFFLLHNFLLSYGCFFVVLNGGWVHIPNEGLGKLSSFDNFIHV